MSDVRVRFAPSPTGTLHVGSARTALYNYLFARHHNGTMVLRIEDTDMKRSQRQYEESILRDLHWLGLRPDEGPALGGPYGPYRQSERGDLYEAGVRRLIRSGWAYRCFCKEERLKALKKEQLSRGEMPKYDRRCLALSRESVERRLACGEPATVRFRVPAGDVFFTDLIHGPVTFSSEVIGDFIIKRTDGGYSYNFAVVIDDAGMRITHVIRGEDHLTNTARQLMLYRALEEPAPTYAHHSLILGGDGGKLSKRHGATSIGEFQELGYLPGALVNYLALLSWHPGNEREKLGLAELVEEFDIRRLSRSPAVFDLDKLNWLNGLYIREIPPAELYDLIQPRLVAEGIVPNPGQRDILAAAIQANLVTLSDAPRYARIYVDEVDFSSPSLRQVLVEPGVDLVLETMTQAVEAKDREYLGLEEARMLLRGVADVCKEQGIKGKTLFHPLRFVLTGRDHGPELFYLVAGLGRSRILARLGEARRLLPALKET